MTSEEFILWFKGFVEATETSTTDLSVDQWKLIKEKLKAVRVKTTLYEPLTISPGTIDNKVLYSEICGCNPKNGGSGICFCTIGNTMVDNPLKDNFSTVKQLITG